MNTNTEVRVKYVDIPFDGIMHVSKKGNCYILLSAELHPIKDSMLEKNLNEIRSKMAEGSQICSLDKN